MYYGTPLDVKKFIVLLHTLSAYNSLLVRYKFYLSDLKECLCTQPEGRLKSMKTHTKLSAPTTRRRLDWNNSVTTKVCLVWSLLLRKITLKEKRDSYSFLRKLSQKFFERKQALKQNISVSHLIIRVELNTYKSLVIY